MLGGGAVTKDGRIGMGGRWQVASCSVQVTNIRLKRDGEEGGKMIH